MNQQMSKNDKIVLVVGIILIFLGWSKFDLGSIFDSLLPNKIRNVTAAVYVYEKDDGPVPVGVYSGIEKLNREKDILASLFEKDTVDGTGETPEQYKPALVAAKAKSIPSLVVLSRTNAVRVLEKPQTETEILEAVP
jgi:hypothetical protein